MSEHRLGFGCNRALPADVHTAWGARLIYQSRRQSCELLWDRQDITHRSKETGQAVSQWLNRHLPQILRAAANTGLSPADDRIVEIYRDDEGVVMGSPQASYGYIYVVAWLHKHREEQT